MSIFFRVPVSVSNPAATIPSYDVRRFKQEFEVDAYDHWIFDSGDTRALTGRMNGKVLTSVGGPHTYGPDSVTINVTSGKALQSDYVATRKQTLCAVVKPNSPASVMVIAGTRKAANSTGSMLYFGSSLTKVSANQYPTFLTELTTPMTSGNYYFCALSESDEGGSTTHIVHASGSSTTHAAGGLKSLSGDAVALGNLQNGNSTSATLSFAEFILIPAAKSATDLLAIYNRSKARMAARGITVV